MGVKRWRLGAAAVLLLGSGGCASFSGMPKSVTAYRQPNGLIKDMRDGLAYVNAAGISDVERKRRRDDEITLYMAAADAQFANFLGSLSSERNGANVALDIAGSAAAGVGSVVTNAAPELAALAGFIGNTKTSINKELYFERTLSALIVAMQTNRLKVRAQIEEHKKLPASDYTLEMAYAELRDYEVAGSINGAIGELNVAAAKSFSDAKGDYSRAVTACVRDESFDAPGGEARKSFRATNKAAATLPWPADVQTKVKNLGNTMRQLNLTPSADAKTPQEVDAQASALQTYLTGLCKPADAQRLKDLLEGK
ncbi:hypothetical protein [Sphingomonas sp.]|uniref:hypothetical protein n=1 Tax=Sphingomonas sp. TaxID=28214 RepID=UPI0025D0375A|nr:hypothetical protein [Sphingomonas sp.]